MTYQQIAASSPKQQRCLQLHTLKGKCFRHCHYIMVGNIQSACSIPFHCWYMPQNKLKALDRHRAGIKLRVCETQQSCSAQKEALSQATCTQTKNYMALKYSHHLLFIACSGDKSSSTKQTFLTLCYCLYSPGHRIYSQKHCSGADESQLCVEIQPH